MTGDSATCISIHAPVKGATPREEERRPVNVISIHAPVKGATRLILHLILKRKFQSTLP